MFKFLVNNILFLLLLAAPAAAQEYVPYAEVSKYQYEDDTFYDGEYYVLVTAPWCEPCHKLKARLKAFPRTRIYTITFDDPSMQVEVKKAMRGWKTIPYLAKYTIRNKRGKKEHYTNQDLNTFMKHDTYQEPISDHAPQSPLN